MTISHEELTQPIATESDFMIFFEEWIYEDAIEMINGKPEIMCKELYAITLSYAMDELTYAPDGVYRLLMKGHHDFYQPMIRAYLTAAGVLNMQRLAGKIPGEHKDKDKFPREKWMEYVGELINKTPGNHWGRGFFNLSPEQLRAQVLRVYGEKLAMWNSKYNRQTKEHARNVLGLSE